MTTQIRNTEVSLEGLLDVLGENLYSTPIISIRELIQNSHDACVRRRIEDGWNETPEIHIHTDSVRSRITITDNGSGLTDKEIIKYLAIIGDGYTRKLRQAQDNEDAIGYFGLGFLSVFVIAEKVEFITTSYQNLKKGWRYSSKGGQRYSLESHAKTKVGSSVIAHLKDDYVVLSDGEFIEQIIKKYCCLLPIDIYVNDSEQPVNRLKIPWRLPTDTPVLRQKKAGLEFAEVFDNHFEPIATFPITPREDCQVNGLLWIQDGSYYANSDNRITTIFIRSMHITDECKDLLPSWAGFVGCIIDTPMLTPTASRESVQTNESFERIQAHINDVLVNALASIAQDNDANWRRIIARHNVNLLGAAVSDQQLFEAMYSQLTLPSSEGELRVSEIVQRSHEKKLRITMEISNGYEVLISKSLGIPILYGYRYGVVAFCKRLTSVMNVELVIIGTNEANADLFPEYALDDAVKDDLLTHFDSERAQTIISHFEPGCLPLILAQDQDALLKKRMESDKMDKQIGSAALMMARQFTQTIDAETDQYLFINYNNELVRDFHSFESHKKLAVAQVLRSIAELLSAHEKTDNVNVFEALNNNLKLLTVGA
ncbi:MAG: Unknown protein [uncultured Thiotrichaceae bacterium]|uniref:Chaperone protein HtpG n=1 Tax=uncultured Thiotrichaceae bacterium TaxID=298394 RepID=A0A6S6SP20_9GAMM|nr:MAG: Unknown protein [uncultured Thiotrichaceae bacterium]